MGKQINFFLNPIDQVNFNELLSTFKDICFLPYYYKSNSITFINDTLIRDHVKEGSRVYLARKQDIHLIKFQYISKFKYWLIDDSFSPVVHYDRCIPIDLGIKRGRFYYQPKYVENLKWITQNEDFIKWSDHLISTVRRKLLKYKFKYEMSKYQYTAYLGEFSLKLINEKKADISLTGDRLILK